MTRPRYVPREIIQQALANLDRTTFLLVGVAEYDHLLPLSGPSFDLDMMSEVLLENRDISLYRNSQIIELGNPTASEFRERLLEYYCDRSARGDILVLYFSGHGCVLEESSFGFCLKDTMPGRDNKGVLPISIVTIEEVLYTLLSYDIHPIFIIDACFSSITAPKGYSHFPDAVKDTMGNVNARAFGLLASSSSSSTSVDTEDGGAFTQTLYSIIHEGIPGEVGKRNPYITINELASPLQEELSRQGLPISRCYVGRDIPVVPIARNIQFQPQTERFSPYMKKIVTYLWNEGSPREAPISDLINAVGRGAYGNHSKLSLPPWDLLEDGEVRKTRRLTDRGMHFAQGNLRIPQVIVRNPSTWDWEATSESIDVNITDIGEE